MTPDQEQDRIAQWYAKELIRYKQRQNDDDTNMAKKVVVVTPVEVTDYIVRSTIQKLRDTYGMESYKQWRLLDPFAGSGLFMCRMMRILPTHIMKYLWSKTDGIVCYEIEPFGAYVCKTNMEREYHIITGDAPPRPAQVYCVDTFSLDPNTPSLTPHHIRSVS